MGREDWRHGWQRMPGDDNATGLLVGTADRCIGCGLIYGVVCVAAPEDWVDPGPVPDWPFEEATCPVHPLRDAYYALKDEVENLRPPQRRLAGPVGKLP